MTCNTCKSFGYLLTAPSTCSAGGERVTCPVCSPKVASDTGEVGSTGIPVDVATPNDATDGATGGGPGGGAGPEGADHG